MLGLLFLPLIRGRSTLEGTYLPIIGGTKGKTKQGRVIFIHLIFIYKEMQEKKSEFGYLY